MLSVKKEGIVLCKTNFDFENQGVLNPAIIKEGNFVHMFYRAVADGNFSTIGYCKFDGPMNLQERMQTPILHPEYDYELHGMEDPRIVRIEGIYYLTYTAYDGINALGALATSTDLKLFEKKGLIVPQITYQEFSLLAETKQKINPKYLRYNEHDRGLENFDKTKLLWDKNVILFPRKINGLFYFLHRIKPDIQVVVAIKSFDELNPEFWRNYFLHFANHIILSPKFDHEISYIGGGCPPIETKEGWLIIYHGVHDTVEGFVYSACAALLSLTNPQQEISRLPYPLFSPQESWEKKGEVNNVCFPTGAALFNDTLFIYYGAADEQIACASIVLSDLLSELLLYKVD